MRVSIAIPTRRRNELLALLLESIGDSADEIIVRDNGEGEARALIGRFPRVRWLFGPELPIFENWRAALDAATGDFVAIPSDDDLYLCPVGPLVSRAGAAPDVDVVIAGHRFVDGDGRVVGGWCPPRREVLAPPAAFLRFQFGVPARMPAVFFRTSFLRRIGSLDTRFALTAADSELVQRAALLGRVALEPEVVAAYRVWPGGLTDQRQLSAQWMEEIEAWSSKLAPMAEEACRRGGVPFDRTRYADELLASNLVAGMARAVKRGAHAEVLRVLGQVRSTRRARPRTRLALARLAATSRLALAWSRWAVREPRR